MSDWLRLGVGTVGVSLSGCSPPPSTMTTPVGPPAVGAGAGAGTDSLSSGASSSTSSTSVFYSTSGGAPLRSASGRPLDVEAALESLSALSALASSASGSVSPARSGVRVAPNSSSSSRSLSPPPRAVSGSRLHLHPTSTPPRVTGSAILHSVTAASGGLGLGNTAKKLLFGASGSRGEAAASVKSAATAAFIAAQEAAARAGTRRTPASLLPSARAPPPQRPFGMGPYFGATVPAGPLGLGASVTAPPPAAAAATAPAPGLDAPTRSASHVPPRSASTSAPPSVPARSSSAVSPAVSTPASSSAAPPLQEPPPNLATKRRTIDDSLARSLRLLASVPRHALSAQFHLVRGLHALRRCSWSEAVQALQQADRLYAPTSATGSTLQRLTSNAAVGATGRALSASTATASPSRSPSGLQTIDTTEEFPLTQPVDDDDDSTPVAVTTGTTTPQTQRTAFVARKAADIKTCLAIATWKQAYFSLTHSSTTPAAASPSSEQETRDAQPTADASYADAQRLFLSALELEGGARLTTWLHLATFLGATRSRAVAKSLLAHVLAEHERHVEETREDGVTLPKGGWALEMLQTKLALMHLADGETDEATLHLHDVLDASAEEEGHHLAAANAYAVLCMQQHDYSSAKRLLEYLVDHDPTQSAYWSNLAVCFEMQTSNQSSPDAGRTTEATATHAGAGATADEKMPPLDASLSSSVVGAAAIPVVVNEFESDRALDEMRARDVALRKNAFYCLEKARFYESVERAPQKSATAAAGAAASDLATSWSFRLNLAQHLLSTARGEQQPVVRAHHYECAEKVLLSITDDTPVAATPLHPDSLVAPRPRGRTEVYTVLGDLYSAQSVSALLDPPESGGGADSSRRFKSRSVCAYARALELDPLNTHAWSQVALLFLHSADIAHANTYLARLVRTIKRESGLDVSEDDMGRAKAEDASEQKTNEKDTTAVKIEPGQSVNAAPGTPSYTPLTASDLDRLSSASPAALRQLSSVLCNFGISLQLSSHALSAERAYLDSLRLSPEEAPTYMNLGNLYRACGRCDEALRAFSRAVQIRPDYAAAWANLALVYVQTEDWVHAYHFMEKAHRVSAGARDA